MAKTIEQIKDEYAKQQGFDSVADMITQWSKDFKHIWIDLFYNKVAKMYANQKLEQAAENLKQTAGQWNSDFNSQKQSILNLREEV